MQINTSGSRRIARIGLIAALYATLTITTLTVLQGLAFGPVQIRLSEAVCVLALFAPEAVWGLTLGCAVANLAGMVLTGTGPLALLDVVFGSLATLLGSAWMWRWRKHRPVALLGPVLSNALIVAAYLPLVLSALGFYTIPFTGIDISESFAAMYLFGFVTIASGEALVVYTLGLPMARLIEKSGLSRQFFD